MADTTTDVQIETDTDAQAVTELDRSDNIEAYAEERKDQDVAEELESRSRERA